MAENESMEGKNLPAEIKEQFEKEVEETIKDLKRGQTVVTPSGFEITANMDKQYVVYVIGKDNGKETKLPVVIVKESKKEQYEFTYIEKNMKKLKKLEEQLKQKEKKDMEDDDTLENDRSEQDIEEKLEEKPEEEPEEQPVEEQEEDLDEEIEEPEKDNGLDVKMDSTAMEIPADKKIGQHYTFATKMQEIYKDIKFEGNEKFFVKADENDRYNFRLYVMKGENGPVIELPVDRRIEGKNAREEQIVVADKDGKKLEKKQPVQIMMIGGIDFGLAMFGEGDRYKELVCVTRDHDDEYNGHVLCKNQKEQELKDGSFETRQGTDNTSGQREHGNDGEPDYKIVMKLKELEEKEVVDEQDVNIDTVEEVSNAIDVTVEGLMEKYGLNEETAKYVAELVMKEEMELDDALFKGYEIEGQELERQGRIAKGSVYYYALGRQDAQKFNEDNSRDDDSGEKVLGPIERKH